MSTKVIKSLTYAETNVPNESGEDFPSDIGTLYFFPSNYSVVGQRLALLLYDKQVKVAEQDKLTVVFSTYLERDELHDIGRLSNDGSRYVTIGVNATEFNAKSDDEKLIDILEASRKALLSFDDELKPVVDEAIKRIIKDGEAINLVYQRKSDNKVEVDLTLNLFDNGQCRIFSTIKDKHGDTLQHVHLEDAHCLSVALQRCGSILIRKNKVIIKPQKNILSKNLKPFEIEYTL